MRGIRDIRIPIRGVLDVLNVELELQHGDVLIRRNRGGTSSRDKSARWRSSTGCPTSWSSTATRGNWRRSYAIAQRHAQAVHVLFLPGDGPPDQWLWDTVRERPDAYAERLRLSAADMQRSMRHFERLVDGAVQQREDMAKVAIRSLAQRLQRMVPDVARIVGRHEARTQALYELVYGLKKLIEQWRRL